jgi:hypothetical protein
MDGATRRQFLARAGMATVAAVSVVRSSRLLAEPLGLPIGSQTYPVRARIAQGQFADVLKDMSAAGIQQIELCSPGYAEFKSLSDGRQTKKIIEDRGMKCVSSHFNYNTAGHGDRRGHVRRGGQARGGGVQQDRCYDESGRHPGFSAQ